jgi:hypothetical protein
MSIHARAAFALMLSLSALTYPALVAGETIANAEFYVGRSLDNLTVNESAHAGYPGHPFPLDHTLSPPLDQLVSEWAYANENGRVRAFAVTRDVQPTAGSVFLYWSKTFQKQTAADTARFNVNRSWLFVYNGSTPWQEQPPSAELEMVVWLSDHAKPQDRYGNLHSEQQFVHTAEINTILRNPLLMRERTWLWGDLFYEFDGERDIREPKSWRQVQTLEIQQAGSFYYEMQPYTGEIDISDVPIGGNYTVSYKLVVLVQDDGRETAGLAYLGDPLDVDSGFSIETTSVAIDDDEAPDACSIELDRGRFVPGSDAATVTDAFTGLTWQRCPVGTTLATAGTTSDLSDDRCTGPDTSVSWQSALQRSADDRTSGFDDWRVPNIKELESIVQLRCRGTSIDTIAFPNTSRDYWSSTATPADGARAEALAFGVGDTFSKDKTATANVRLVRRSPSAPIAPLPAVSVGVAAEVSEGNDGTRTLTFPLRLDSTATGDVSVTYQTRDATATAGSDYVATSGTAVIPEGALAAEIQVTVQGDSLGEPQESMDLVITNVSANARIGEAIAYGRIVDDEPVASVMQVDATEPQSGTEAINMLFALDRPAATDVTLTYEIVAGTATPGVDFSVSNGGTGEILFPAGEQYGGVNMALLVDPLVEGDEYFIVRLTDISENARIGALTGAARAYIIDSDDAGPLTELNDTGLDVCADEDEGILACPQPRFPGQDAEQGRDFTANNDADGHAGFAFLKLDANGAPLANQSATYAAAPWDCVLDGVTGLYWEVKTNDGGLRDMDWSYTWYNSSGINDGGNAGVQNGGTCVDTANCDTEKYVAAVNAAGLCGRNDWRLPTREELYSIVTQNEIFSRAPYDLAFFPNTIAVADYLTSSPRPWWEGTLLDTNFVWSIYWDRGYGTPRHRSKSIGNRVRLVSRPR